MKHSKQILVLHVCAIILLLILGFTSGQAWQLYKQSDAMPIVAFLFVFYFIAGIASGMIIAISNRGR